MGCDNEFRTILFDVRVADLSKVKRGKIKVVIKKVNLSHQYLQDKKLSKQGEANRYSASDVKRNLLTGNK